MIFFWKLSKSKKYEKFGQSFIPFLKIYGNLPDVLHFWESLDTASFHASWNSQNFYKTQYLIINLIRKPW